MKKLILPIIAIVFIAVLEIVALGLGINGVGLSLAIGSICTIAGWCSGRIKR